MGIESTGAGGDHDEDADYESRVRNERGYFGKAVDIHKLPQAHHYWTNKYLRPEVQRVFGCAGPVEIYAQEIRRAFERSPSRQLVSLGCGWGDTEMLLVERLAELDIRDFELECLEITPRLCESGQRRANEKGLGDRIRFTCADLNRWQPAPGAYAAVVANEILHHIVEIERLFDGIAQALAPGGRLLTRDVMGRNGHLCWPEVRAVVDALWEPLPERYKFDWQTDATAERYPDRDCSTEGFEGIRAEDVLPNLVERFQFERFVGFGGLVERFAGRAFGHNFRVDDEEADRVLIDVVYQMNRLLIDQGLIKPTQLVATLAVERVEPVYGFGWSPAHCVRPPG